MTISYLLQFLISAILSFLLCKIFLGKHEGDKPERSVKLKIGEYRIHVHHWIWCSVVLITLVLLKIFNPILLGLLTGAIIQGLLYRDRFVVVYKDKDFEKIYSKYSKK